MATKKAITSDQRQARDAVAADAAGEIEAWVRTLAGQANEQSFDLLLRGALIRIRRLNSVVLSVVGGDDNRNIDEMLAVVSGEERANG